jgi:dolichol-phosphate mannosyltransferase
MAANLPLLSVVCPAYQEEDVLPHFHRELARVLDWLTGKYDVEVIYVDDGSRDRTLDLLHHLARQDSRIRYLSLSRNFGHQAALTAGLEHARGDAVVTLDSDLQHPPALLPVLVQKWQEGCDVVITVREEDPGLGWFKRASSRWFYRVMGLVSETEIRMAAADFRLLSRRAVDALLRLRETHRFLRGMVQWLGFRVAEVPFRPGGRKAGVSKYTLRRMISFAGDGILSFSKLPLRLSFFGGLAALAASVLFACWTALRACTTGGAVDFGGAALLTSLYFMGGCVLCGLGIVGEYVGRIYDQVRARPLYLLKDQSPELGTPVLRTTIDKLSLSEIRGNGSGGQAA